VGRQSCSIQQPVTSVDVAADFRANFNSYAATERSRKEQAMKKEATKQPSDGTNITRNLSQKAKLRRLAAGVAIAAAASMTVHGTVGNQSASGR
jgi:hypothetical protein